MSIVDTGDYLSDFGENLETYLEANLASIQFKDRSPDVKHDFPRDRDPAPNIRIMVPRGTPDYQEGAAIMRMTARLNFTGQDVLDQAKEIESWAVKIANLASGERSGQKNYWQTNGYMIRVYVSDIEIFLVQLESGALEVTGRVELTAEKQI